MIFAVELTTHCNFDCGYCYTKKYDNKMMDVDTYRRIIDEIDMYPVRSDISLSGEGESLLHPNFWEYVEYAKKTKHEVSVITNGSTLTSTNIALIKQNLTRVRVSLDTMDAELAKSVGRYYHERVVENIRELVRQQIQVIILTTNFGQDLSGVREFVKSLRSPKVQHAIQPLQTKKDYSSAYVGMPVVVPPIHRPNARVSCSNINPPKIIAYDVNGIKTPCCYIKDKQNYVGFDELTRLLTTPGTDTVPQTCIGCKYLQYHKKS